MKTHRFQMLCIGMLGISTAHSELLISEPFDYSDLDLVIDMPANPDTGLTGAWAVSGHPDGTPGSANFLFDSLEFANHFEPVGSSFEVRHLEGDGSVWSGLGASIGIGADLNVPVLWSSTLLRVTAPAAAFYNDWRVEQRLSPAINSGDAATALRINGRAFGSGTGSVGRAAIGADSGLTAQDVGTIDAGTVYLYLTRSTIVDGSITETKMFVFNEAAYGAYLVAAIANPPSAETLLDTHALFSLTDTATTPNLITDKSFIQFSIGGGPLGTYDDIRFGTALEDVVNLTAPPEFNLELQSASLNFTGGVITIRDVETAVVDETRLEDFLLEIDGDEVTPTVSKTEGVTTISFDYPVEPNFIYFFVLEVPREEGGIQEFFDPPLNSYTLPLNLPGPEGAVGSWGIRELQNDPLAPLATSIATAAEVAVAAAEGTFVEASAVPVFNHTDPDTNGPAARGNFNNDFPILSNTGVDDGWVVVGKTKIDVAAGEVRTFSVHSDDGFTMRISGAGGGRFIAVNGSGAIDPGDNQTIFLDGGTGDSNTRGVYQFDSAGTYDITYLGWDGGGGGFYEVASAVGNFPADRDTNTWTLLGSPNDPSVTAIPFEDRFVQDLPGPPSTAGNFSVRSYREAAFGNIQDVSNFVRDTTRLPTDADGFTLDVMLPSMRARDPEDGGGSDATYPAFPGNTPALDDNIVISAKARFSVASTTTYTFWVRSDDGFLLRIKGANGTPDPGFDRATQGGNAAPGRFEMSNPNELFFQDGTGNSDTRGIITLQPGTYDLDYLGWEGGGGFFYELTSAEGSWPHGTTPPTGWQLVGFEPVSTSVSVPGIADPGWTVESANPDRAEYVFSIAGAEAAIDAALLDDTVGAAKVSNWDRLDFTDPEAGADGSFTPNNIWPLNTGNDDNNYAMRAKGVLNITEAGTYHLGFQGDDGGYLQIEGPLEGGDPVQFSSIVATNHVPEAALIEGTVGSGIINRLSVQVGTGNSRTIGSIDLPVGTYNITTLVYEGTGGSWWEVVGAKAPVDSGFAYPLLIQGAGQVVSVASGIPLIDQSGTVIPHIGPFVISGFGATGNPVTSASFDFSSTTGASYSVQGSIDLQNWTTIQGGIIAAGTSTSVTIDTTSLPAPLTGSDKVFFRVFTN